MSRIRFNHSYIGDLDRFPLLLVHALLPDAEELIDAAVRKEGGALLQKWETVKHPDDVRTLHGIDHELRDYFKALAYYVREREQMEIDALLSGRDA